MASIGIAESISTMAMASIVAWLVSLQPTRIVAIKRVRIRRNSGRGRRSPQWSLVTVTASLCRRMSFSG